MNCNAVWIPTGTRFLATLWLLTFAAVAHAQTPTQAQIDVFSKLPPEQQKAVLEQLSQRSSRSLPDAPEPAVPASQPKPGVDEPLVEFLRQDPRLRPEDSLIIGATVRELPEGAPPRSLSSQRAVMELRARILDGNPYRLGRTGVLSLPGTAGIPLAGLNAEQVRLRLNTEPSLRDLVVTVAFLPVEPELKPFGYELFANVPTTFAPATDIPVPAEYVLGPGDTLEVQLIGERGGRYSIIVGRDGTIDFPELGPIPVAGMRYSAAKVMLEQRVAEQMIGMRASISIGQLRSIQVFVVGEAERPGSYTVSGLSTITHGLFSSGGVKPIGTLRSVQLKRNGQLVRQLDLYDLLLHGDTSDDLRLLPGDVIFIPPVGATAAISGEVRRPAIYELKEGNTAEDLLQLAGGLTPEADPRTARLQRIDNRQERTALDLDLTQPDGRGTRLQTGDSLRIDPIRDRLEGAVRLSGHVFRPGTAQHRSGMRLTDLIPNTDELRPLADLNYVLIRRESGPGRRVSAVSADLAEALRQPGGDEDVALESGDVVHVFDLSTSRDRVVDPIIRELLRQSSHQDPFPAVTIAGRVKVPGQYPLEPGMTVRDLVRAAGGLDESAYSGEADLARYVTVGGEERRTDIIPIALSAALAGDPSANARLQPFDYLVIKRVANWSDFETVVLAGEVMFPGTYSIRRGETLRSVISRAGGLTPLAFAAGSVFTRAELKEREQRQLEVLAERLQRELAALALQQARSEQAAAADEAMRAGQDLLADLRTTEAVGRLVFSLEEAMTAAPESSTDIVLKNGDELFVPRKSQEVTVLGEVQNATSHFWDAAFRRDDYIQMSGGLTRRADGSRVFVIRADGSVAESSTSAWFRRQSGGYVEPGDTIVVPIDAERVRPLTLWTSVTQILYNIAVAVAAVNSL